MVALDKVVTSNTSLRTSQITGQISFFVGATSGLGLATLTEYVRNANQPKIYIAGRSPSKLSSIIKALKGHNPEGEYHQIVSEYSLFKNVDEACEELKAKTSRLDLLMMSPGYLKPTRQPDNADGVEETLSLRYYVRARFIQQLLPLLAAAPTSRIVSIHGGGKEGVLNESDLLLQRTFSIANAAMHTCTMNTLALQEVAAQNPTISCVHVFPGLVVTPGIMTFAEDWPWFAQTAFAWLLVPLIRLITVSLSESGVRHCFHSTSARFPPASVTDGEVDAGAAPLPAGVVVAKGADGNSGSGCYILGWNGEAVGDQKLLDDYRKKDWGRKIWEHTQEVFDQAKK